jgi:glyoxylase-like metal-dependent hydrolase (beta-lactamase superfamily II)
MLKQEVLVLGNLETNCYIVWDEETKKGLVIDPADDGVGISEEVENRKIKLVGVVLTHGHFDHCLAALDLKLIYNVPIYLNNKDKFLLDRQDKTVKYFLKRDIKTPNLKEIDKDLENIKEIKIGKSKLEVIRTPGHTPGSICLYSKENNVLFSGDTLFKDLRGRTDFKYGSTKKIYESLKTLIKFPKDTEVYSGHGEPTTIGREKEKYVFN